MTKLNSSDNIIKKKIGLHMRRRKSLIFGLISPSIYMLCGLALLIVIIVIPPDNTIDTIVIAAMGAVFCSISTLNIFAVIMAPYNKFMRGLLLTFAIFGLLFGGVLGALTIFSYKFCKDYIQEGDIPCISLKERIRHRRERRRERKEMLRLNPEYANYIKYLKGRKCKAVFRSLALLIMSLTISFPGLLIYIKFFLVAIEESLGGPFLGGGFMAFFIPFAVYIGLSLIILAINGVQIGFSSTSSKTTTTKTYVWEEGSFLGIDTSDWRETDSKTKTKYSTFYFFTWKTVVFILFGWLMFIPLTIGFFITLFTKYDSDFIVCGVRPDKIPSRYLRTTRQVASITSFFLGFVAIEYGYLDYMYEVSQKPKKIRR